MKSILLVEDNPDDEELTMLAFRQNNISNDIAIARDGAEALDMLYGPDGEGGTIAPTLILLDLKLPKVDGLEVLRRIKGNPRTATIPVVVVTSSKEQRDLVESYQLGVNSYIVKPVNFERFTAAVRDVGLYWLLLNQPPPATE